MAKSRTPRRKLEATQPDYTRWALVAPGMTRAEVTALIGEPVRHRTIQFPPDVLYGYIHLRDLPGLTYAFSVRFGDHDRVEFKCDPFGSLFSPDGRPTPPRLVIPLDHARFQDHAPLLVDVRWHPSSGEYPMSYAVEVGRDVGPPGHPDWVDHVWEENVAGTHVVIRPPASRDGRVRVRGQNRLGAGEWSEYRHFSFSGWRER